MDFISKVASIYSPKPVPEAPCYQSKQTDSFIYPVSKCPEVNHTESPCIYPAYLISQPRVLAPASATTLGYPKVRLPSHLVVILVGSSLVVVLDGRFAVLLAARRVSIIL